MKKLEDILLLGNPRLYEVSDPVLKSELPLVPGWVADMHNVVQEIRTKYYFGRAIAAPQLGIMKRLIYLNIDKPVIIINPQLSHQSMEMIELWDDCMSFPNLSGNTYGNYEAMAYIDAGKTGIMIVMSSRTKEGFDNSLQAFESLVRSYVFVANEVIIEYK